MGGSVKKRIHVGDKVDCIYTKGMDTGEFSHEYSFYKVICFT